MTVTNLKMTAELSTVVEQPKPSEWEGIPGRWIDDSTAIDGHRFVASKHAIPKLRDRSREAAKGRCEECRRPCYWGERHHVYGRGFGSGKREDRPVVCGERFVVWLCGECHRVAVILPWGSWKTLTNQGKGVVENDRDVVLDNCVKR